MKAAATDPQISLKCHMFYGTCLLALFIVTYWSTLNWMYGRFVSPDSYYSHGFIIPIVSAWLIWRKKDELKETEILPSWSGLALIAVALLFHLAGTILYVFSISGFSIVLLIVGIALFLLGKKATKLIFFPLVLLIFMMPIPEAFISIVAFPLKMLVAKTGVGIASFSGIPILREGFNIVIPEGSMVVGNPCSGLRSLIGFMFVGAVFGYISDSKTIFRWALFILAIPIAVASNIVRVPFLIYIAHHLGIDAASPEAFWHDASGIMVIILGFVFLFCSGKMLKWQK